MRGDVREEHQPRPEPGTPHHRRTHAPWIAPALYHMTHSSPHRTGTPYYRGVPPTPPLSDSCVHRNTQKHLTIPSLASLLPGLVVGSSALPTLIRMHLLSLSAEGGALPWRSIRASGTPAHG